MESNSSSTPQPNNGGNGFEAVIQLISLIAAIAAIVIGLSVFI
jgi:hypothetical protein